MTVFFADEQDEPVDPAPLLDLARRVLSEEGLPSDAEVAIVLVDPDQMADYNSRFMARSGPTDVLAFPLEDLAPGSPPPHVPGAPPLGLGDVLICPAVVRDNAAGAGVSFDDEMALMVVHGVLHLLGWDHEADDEAAAMEEREAGLLALVGRSRP